MSARKEKAKRRINVVDAEGTVRSMHTPAWLTRLVKQQARNIRGRKLFQAFMTAYPFERARKLTLRGIWLKGIG